MPRAVRKCFLEWMTYQRAVLDRVEFGMSLYI